MKRSRLEHYINCIPSIKICKKNINKYIKNRVKNHNKIDRTDTKRERVYR